MSQSPEEVMMVRPASFGFNLETSLDNAFQNNDLEREWLDLNLQAQIEFDKSVQLLRWVTSHKLRHFGDFQTPSLSFIIPLCPDPYALP